MASITADLSLEELYQARLISLRSRLWDSSLEKLLRKWRRQIAKRQSGHTVLSRRCSTLHYILGVPTSILSAVVSTGSFATFRDCQPGDSQTCQNDEWIRLAIAIVSLLSTIMTALTIFLGYSARYEQHKNASDSYESLIRDIDLILRTPVSSRGDAISTVSTIRDKYDDIVKNSPTLPAEYDVDFTYTVMGSENGRPSPPKPEDISIGESRPKSEDNVTIPIDIDCQQPDDVFTSERRHVDESLNHALRFQLSRLGGQHQDDL